MHNTKNDIGITGVLSMWLLDPCSLEIIDKRICKNLVVATGLTWLASKCANKYGPAGLSHIAVGTDNSAPVTGDIGLVAEVGRAQLSMGPWQGIGSDSHKFYVRAAFTTAEAVATLAEVGLFYGSVAFARTLVSPAIVKPSDKILVMQWEYIFSGT